MGGMFLCLLQLKSPCALDVRVREESPGARPWEKVKVDGFGPGRTQGDVSCCPVGSGGTSDDHFLGKSISCGVLAPR